MRSVSWTSTSRNKAPPRRPPGATNRDPVAAHSVRHEMRTRREPAANPHPDTTAKEEPP